MTHEKQHDLNQAIFTHQLVTAAESVLNANECNIMFYPL